MMQKDCRNRTLLAMAVESGSEETYKAVLEAVRRRLSNKQVRRKNNTVLDTVADDSALLMAMVCP